MDPDIATWLLDVLGQLSYQGKPDDLDVTLARHRRGVEQLSAIVEPGKTNPGLRTIPGPGAAVLD